MTDAHTYAAFAGEHLVHRGPLVDVLAAIKLGHFERHDAQLLIFENETGREVDFDLRGTLNQVLERVHARTAPKAAGRPKLGVESREVTLLPRHWDWLAGQPGGASQALRRLIDEARRADGGATRLRLARERAYRFMAAMAGDLPGFEEASRALFAGDGARFEASIAAWSKDLRDYAVRLAADTAPDGAA